MTERFDVQIQPDRRRIVVTLAGFATLDDVASFNRSLTTALSRVGQPKGVHQVLYDVSAAQIQSQDVVFALRELVLSSPKASAFALVNASALAGRQLARIFAGVDVHFAADRQDAVRWLDGRVCGGGRGD